MAAVWEQADFDAAYQRWHPGFGVYQASYRRPILGPDGSPNAWAERARQWGMKLGGAANPASSVLIVGCGFGWFLESIADEFNHPRIWGTDISTWIQAEKGTHARADIAPLILNINILDADARSQLRTAGAGQQGRFNWIVTEHVVEGLDPAIELDPFLDATEGLIRPGGNVAHIVASEITPPGEGDQHDRGLGIRWQSHAEWIAERPAHYWIDIHGWEIGGGD